MNPFEEQLLTSGATPRQNNLLYQKHFVAPAFYDQATPYDYAENMATAEMVNRNASANLNQERMREWAGRPVKAQNKAMKNRWTDSAGHPDNDLPAGLGRKYARDANYDAQIMKNPNMGVYDVQPNDGFNKRITAELSPYEYGGRPLVNKLARPMRSLPAIAAPIGAAGGVLGTAMDIQDQVNQAGGWMNWLRGRPAPPPEL